MKETNSQSSKITEFESMKVFIYTHFYDLSLSGKIRTNIFCKGNLIHYEDHYSDSVETVYDVADSYHRKACLKALEVEKMEFSQLPLYVNMEGLIGQFARIRLESGI